MKWEEVSPEQAQSIKEWFEADVFIKVIAPLIASEQDQLAWQARDMRDLRFLDEANGMGKVVVFHDKAMEVLDNEKGVDI